MTGRPPGMLHGLRVVELASEHAAFAGKMLADGGAEVVVVEPPGGHRTRWFEPFLDDEPGLERSLHWWHYNAGKLGVTVDLEAADGADDDGGVDLLRRLLATADIVLEGETSTRLADLGVDHTWARTAHPDLVWVSVTPHGVAARTPEPAPVTDLTILAAGGPVWSCGYDDHDLPPVRGGGNQGYQTACVWAVVGALTAVLHRDVTGAGQHVDVSMHAAANVTTEAATYEWLVGQRTVQRQTGRHAAVVPTMGNRVTGTDGRTIQTGVPPRTPAQFRALLAWMDEVGTRDDFPEAFFLEMGAERPETDYRQLGDDVEATAILGAAREALNHLAARCTSEEFFKGAQRHGLAVGINYSPEEVLADEHFVARGFPVDIEHPELDRVVRYPGAPFVADAAPWRVARRAPLLGEHDDQVLGPLRAGCRSSTSSQPGRHDVHPTGGGEP